MKSKATQKKKSYNLSSICLILIYFIFIFNLIEVVGGILVNGDWIYICATNVVLSMLLLIVYSVK